MQTFNVITARSEGTEYRVYDKNKVHVGTLWFRGFAKLNGFHTFSWSRHYGILDDLLLPGTVDEALAAVDRYVMQYQTGNVTEPIKHVEAICDIDEGYSIIDLTNDDAFVGALVDNLLDPYDTDMYYMIWSDEYSDLSDASLPTDFEAALELIDALVANRKTTNV